MDGITVLYEFTQREWWAMAIISSGSILGTASLVMAFCSHDDIDILVPSILGVLLCLILVGFSCAYDGRDNYQKVMIDDSVNLVEFNEHYKIISQEGKMVTCEKPFDENRWNECSSGIHFFINRQEAVEYY